MGSQYSKNYAKQKKSREANRLRRQLMALKKMPSNFRDMDFESQAFLDLMAVITDATMKKEMAEWFKGPIMYCHPLTNIEKRILGSCKLVRSTTVNTLFKDNDESTHFKARVYVPTVTELYGLLKESKSLRYKDVRVSFLYIKNLPENVYKGLNALCQHGNLNVRLKHELTDKDGVTPGL